MEQTVHLDYDPETDILNIDLQDSETPLAYGEEVQEGVVAHYGKDGALVSLEVHDISRRYAGGVVKRRPRRAAPRKSPVSG